MMRGSVLLAFSMSTLLAVSATGMSLPESQGATLQALQTLVTAGDGVNTDAVIVLKDGQILFETYGRGYTASTKHLSWSTAKTVAGILIGQAIEEGRLSLQDPANKYLPEVSSDATIQDLLQMSSGIQFKEEYSGVPVTSDATKMLYLEGPKTGFASYVASLPDRVEFVPGNHFYYSSGDTNVLMEILKQVIPTKGEYDSYPWKKLFLPMGIQDVTFEQDSVGTFVGSSYLYLTARDFLKFGQLLMQNGQWEGKQLIPSFYMELMKEVAPGVQQAALTGTSPTRAYSMQVTTNRPVEGRGLPSEYADLPEDALLMIGHQGQLVVASLSQKLVIVRLATDQGSAFDRKGFFKAIRNLIRTEDPSYTVAGPGDASKAQVDSGSAQKPAQNSKAGLSDYFKVPHLIRALAAKEFCSCRLVIGRTEKACREDLKKTLPILPRLRIRGNEVTAKLGTGVFGRVSKARFVSANLGCTLVETE